MPDPYFSSIAEELRDKLWDLRMKYLELLKERDFLRTELTTAQSELDLYRNGRT